MSNTSTEAFRKARDFLLVHREDYAAAYRGFRWPELDDFNWALDWFDVFAKGNRGIALRVFSDDGEAGSRTFDTLYAGHATFTPDRPTKADDPLLLYFTSGTTAKPKLVLHTHRSYPIGHLSTMYWIGCRPGDVHFNISSPGWAKHAWSSVFAPWNAGAASFVFDYAHFKPRRVLDALVRCEVTTLCGPPTVWR